MQKILQETKEKDLGVPEGNFKLYPFFLLAIATGTCFGELLDIDRERDISLETNTIDINTQVTRDDSGKPLKTSSDLYAHWVPEMNASATNTIGTKSIL